MSCSICGASTDLICENCKNGVKPLQSLAFLKSRAVGSISPLKEEEVSVIKKFYEDLHRETKVALKFINEIEELYTVDGNTIDLLLTDLLKVLGIDKGVI